MESQPPAAIPQLDELAHTQPGALEAALEEMVQSGFGNLEAQLPPTSLPSQPKAGIPPNKPQSR